MKELKLKIYNIKNVVLMEVLQQDESLRGKGKICEASNGFEIKSNCCPSLFIKEIYIKGENEELDNILCCREFKTAKQAEEYVQKAKAAIEEYNASTREVLNNAEKEYLRAVIKPFRDKVKCIYKDFCYFDKKEYIEILVGGEYFALPSFMPCTMYRGMETEKRYTLEELGL